MHERTGMSFAPPTGMANSPSHLLGASVFGALAGGVLVGCVDAHHFDAHDPHHDDHHYAHHDDHHVAPYPAVITRPAPPSQPPVPGPGHWVWDDSRQQYIWVSERSQP